MSPTLLVALYAFGLSSQSSSSFSMKTLAKALIQAAAFLELSGEDVVTLDGSVKVLDDIATILQSASADELAAVRETLHEMTLAERSGLARSEVLRFYETFCEDFGITT
jgi:hypothetical protein